MYEYKIQALVSSSGGIEYHVRRRAADTSYIGETLTRHDNLKDAEGAIFQLREADHEQAENVRKVLIFNSLQKWS